MAAFEIVSKTTIKTYSEETAEVDVRIARIPFERPMFTGFDPRDHREPKNEIKPWMAYFNLLRTSFGAGMLGLPMAMSQAGIVLGPIMTISVGMLFIHTHVILLWCLNEISRQLQIPQIAYRYGFRIALLHGPPCLHSLGRCGPALVGTIMVLSQLGICSISVILTADNVRDMMDFKSMAPALLWIYCPYMLLEIMMKNLKIISYITMVGNVLLALGLLLVCYLVIDDPHGDVKLATNNPLAFFLALGMMQFNMSAVGVVLTCEKALKNPKIMGKWLGVIPVGIMVPTVVSCIFGSVGYYAFGTMEENVLRSLPYDSNVSMFTFTLYLAAMCLGYPINCYPAVQILIDGFKNQDPLVTPSDKSVKMVEYVSRPAFVTLTFLIAYILPFQASLVAFVGHLCTSILSLIFPALMEIGLLYPDNYGPYNYIMIKDVIIVAVGVVCWVFGVYICGYHLYILYLALKSPNSTEFA